MLVTVIADASHCPDTKAAGYAFWIGSNRGNLFKGGRMSQPCPSSVVAEMIALVNGVYIGIKEGYIVEGDMLCLQSDCIPAIQKLKGKALPTSSGEEMVSTYFKRTVEQFNLNPYFKHVRGHTTTQDGRSAVNRRCDAKAYRFMKKMRMSLKIKELRETLT